MHEFATNIYAMTNSPGFQASADWAYNTPASTYFWAGFIVAFTLGLVSVTLTWIRRLIGAGPEQ